MKKRSLSLLHCVASFLTAIMIVLSITPVATASSNQCDHKDYEFVCIERLSYEMANDDYHYVYELIRVKCPYCGAMGLAYNNITVYQEHTFDSNGRCTKCGYTSSASGDCKHINKKSEKIGTSMTSQYDETYHKLIATYKDICADCGKVLTESRKETSMGLHQFGTDGSCYCGYVRQLDVCSHTPIETLKSTRYSVGDVNGHEVIKTYHYECKCKQVSYDDVKTSVGAHEYDRNTCRLCGFEKECEHLDFENVVSVAVEKDPNGDSTHIVVTTYAEKCFCGATNPNPVKRTTESCRFIKNTDVQSMHEEQGHQYVDVCECGNEKVNGKYKNYLEGCVVCEQLYENYVLFKGNASNIPEKVMELQELLVQCGYDLPYYGADGDFSRETEKAVENFQKDHDLPVTGIVDEATWNALKNALNYTDTISRGNPSNKSHVVMKLQELLIKNGYDLPYYGADGDFSRETENAVKKFQKDHGLAETGVVDEAIWAMLRNPNGTFETAAPSHGSMEGLPDDKPSHSPEETLPPKVESDSETREEPEHGPLEGIETDLPAHSPEATLPPKVNSDSDVIIDGAFGDTSYTVVLGDTLYISVSANCKNANLVRATINVDGSSIDRLASETISGTAWSGTLPLNCNVYPLDTPGTYTLKLYVSADAGDPDWSIVDYATLVINDTPVKPDEPIVNEAIDRNTLPATCNVPQTQEAVRAIVDGNTLNENNEVSIPEVIKGRIRYISQLSDSPFYVTDYWENYSGKSIEYSDDRCDLATFSSAISYMGYDITPADMAQIMASSNPTTIGVRGETGIGLVADNKLRESSEPTASAKMTIDDSFWELYENYSCTTANMEYTYTPVAMYYHWHGEEKGNNHWVLILGVDATNPYKWYVTDAGYKTVHYVIVDPETMTIIGANLNAGTNRDKTIIGAEILQFSQWKSGQP